jgi:hypothetical protein
MCCTGWTKCLLIASLLLSPRLMLAGSETPMSRGLVINEEYQVGKFQQWLFGRDYRQLWATPVVLPELQLGKTAGGLTPIREVGQLQTAGLAMAGQNGRAYTFRSVRKDPARALPPEYQGTAVADMVQDQVSADLPAASLLVAPINQAAGLLHTRAELLLMPDDPALGDFREKFAGVVGTFQEYPTKDTFQAEAIISGGEIFDRLQQDADQHVDTHQYLTARLVDFLVGDWDRHIGQWRWVKLPGNPHWLPLAEDRDHAFSRYDGVVMAVWRDREPRFLNFSPEFEPLEGTAWRGRELDRRLLGSLSASDFASIARRLQTALNDKVLAESVGRMPSPWRALKGDFIYQSLRHRRDDLLNYAMRYYRLLAAEVDVFGSDLPATYRVNKTAAGGVKLTIAPLQGPPANSCDAAVAAGEPVFSRQFSTDETRQLRVYMGGGTDTVQVDPELPSTIQVYLVSKPGPLIVCDPDAETQKLMVPEGPGKGLALAGKTWLAPAQHNQELNWQQKNAEGSALTAKRDWGSTSYGLPGLTYSEDLGIFIGYGRAWERFGFRQRPYAQRHRLRGGYSFGRDRPTIDYQWDYRFVNRPLSLTVGGRYSGIDSVNYFGFGNETANEFEDSFYDTDTTSIQTGTRLTRSSDLGNWWGELLARHTNTKMSGLVGLDQPTGFGLVRQAGFGLGYAWSSREQPTRQAAGTDEEWRYRPSTEQPGYGLRAEVENYLAAWDLDEAYGLLRVQGRADYRLWRAFDRLSLRLGLQQNWGEYPYYDAAVIGSRQVRGLVAQRFAGDASIYANIAVKFDLGDLQIIIPGRWGWQLRGDAGRVFYSEESSSVWHPSAGAGLWWKPVTGATSINLLVARSREDMQMYFMVGAKF